jgi:hypothetical protein
LRSRLVVVIRRRRKINRIYCKEKESYKQITVTDTYSVMHPIITEPNLVYATCTRYLYAKKLAYRRSISRSYSSKTDVRRTVFFAVCGSGFAGSVKSTSSFLSLTTSVHRSLLDIGRDGGELDRTLRGRERRLVRHFDNDSR